MDLKLLWENIQNKVHSVSALFAGTLLLLVVFVFGDNFLSKYTPAQYLRWVYVGLFLIWVGYWLWYRFRLPRNGKTKTGLVLCIYADTEEAEKSLKRDFVDSLKKQMINEGLGEIFNIITIKNHQAIKFNNFESIKKLHNKVHGHIYIFGETKKRTDAGGQYFLSLDGLVLHRPVQQQVSQELAKDFLATLPKGINFASELAFTGFQVSADVVVKCVKYIVGIASFISGHPLLAIKLHTNIKNQLVASAVRLPGDNIILSKIDSLLSEEYAIVAAYYLTKEDKLKTQENLALALGLNHNCYRALIVESIVAFSWEHDPNKSLVTLKKCHGFSAPEWRYNEAFIYFWQGNYSLALKQCEKIKDQNYPNELPTTEQVTQFNEKLLTTIDKPALYFWLGFNFYYKQKNLPLALKNLELFEQKADGSMTALKNKSSAWLVEIKRSMGVK